MSAEPSPLTVPDRRQRIALIVLLVLPVAAVGLAACAGLVIMVRSVMGKAQDLDPARYVALASPALAFGFVALAALFLYLLYVQGWRLRSLAGALALDALVLFGGVILWWR